MIDLKKTSYHQGARGFSEAYADACQEDAVIGTYFSQVRILLRYASDPWLGNVPCQGTHYYEEVQQSRSHILRPEDNTENTPCALSDRDTVCKNYPPKISARRNAPPIRTADSTYPPQWVYGQL